MQIKVSLFYKIILILFILPYILSCKSDKIEVKNLDFDLFRPISLKPEKKGKKKTNDERAMFHLARELHEYYMQVNPLTGIVSKQDKADEQKAARLAAVDFEGRKSSETSLGNFSVRGPSNLGGRTRALAFDISDATGNTMLAGGVSSGVFRTTNAGASWNRVSSMDNQHNVTCIVQDPRAGFQNIWYYSTGEGLGNSASFSGAFYAGHGIWRSTDSGLSWNQMTFPAANNEFTFDQRFDIINRLAVHPTTGDLFVAALGIIYRFDISDNVWRTELAAGGGFNTNHLTDVVITTGGRVYVTFSGRGPATHEGVWTSTNATGNVAGAWTRFALDGNPVGWNQRGRAVLVLAPSNQNILYVLFESNAATPSPGDSDLWRWNQGTATWTDFSNKIPDEPGGSAGNDPFDSQGGYDIVVSVKPDNENFVVIGGTNVYKVTNINVANFVRMGGYAGPSTYALWAAGGGVAHHPDIHCLLFNPFNPNSLLSGSDGGVHRTIDLNAATVGWSNLNNNYITYQYYHVYLDPLAGSNGVLGGAQDNGTTAGGTNFGYPNNTVMSLQLSGDGCACAISRANACTPFFMSSQSGGIRRDCPTNASIRPAGSISEFVTYFWLDPSNNNNLYYAGENILYRTTNATNVTTVVGAGATDWRNLGQITAGTDYIKTMTTSWGPYNAASSKLFVGTDEGRILRLNDPANAANLAGLVNITPAGATVGFPSVVSALAIHPSNANILIAAYSNYGSPSIFLTNNANATVPAWVNISRNIEALSVRSISIVEAGGSTLYVAGTTRGLYTSPDPTTTDWSRVGNNTIGMALVSQLMYRPADQKLLVGTHGNGMFLVDVIPPLLPVALTEFKADFVKNAVDLQWNTASELNNKGFEIQRSVDGLEFEKLVFVDAKNGPNASIEQFYDYKDADIKWPIHYYRLKQIDLDETVTYSKIIAISTGKHNFGEINIYPNPVVDRIGIDLGNNDFRNLKIEIYSANGDLLYNRNFYAKSRFEIMMSSSEFPAGMYFLRLLEADMLIESRKLFKK